MYNNQISGTKLIIFDFDGTIVSLNVDWQGLKEELRDFCEKEYKTKITMKSMNQFIEEVAEKIDRNFKKKADEIIKKYELANITKFKRNNKIVELIDAIKGKKKLAILSNNCLETIEKILDKMGVWEAFDKVIGREMLNKMKPNPEGLRRILKSFPEVEKSEVLFIGNKPEDKITGENIGVKTIII